MREKNTRCMFALLIGIVSLSIATGCGPISYTAKVLDATAAIEVAHGSKAWKLACFEYYSSIRYMKKAMEEAGFSDFEAAAILADKSWKYAKLARRLTRQREIRREDLPVVCRAPADILKFYRKKKAPTRLRLEKEIVN